MTAAAGPVPTGRRWPSAAGAWLGIGAAPGALVLGAQVAQRNDGALPLVVLLAGGLVMAALLAGQGMLGLLPPAGENSTLSAASARYLPPVADHAVALLMTLAMIGWFGFNVGLGGAALGALTGLPDWAAAIVLGLPLLGVIVAGGGRWNGLAIVATCSAIVLIGLVALRTAPSSVPVSLTSGGPRSMAVDLAGFLGYVSVFAMRAPDFTVGLRGRRDLAWCVALLVGPALAAAIVGAGLSASTGSSDVVATLAGPQGMAAANLFLAVAVVAPTLACIHSGSLALGRLARLPRLLLPWAVAIPGLVLAMLRVDRLMADWLVLLAAAVPALVVPMVWEAARRRRGGAPELISTWAWLPAAVIAVLGTLAGYPEAALAGLGLAVLAAMSAQWWRRRKAGDR
ncbi:SLC5/6 family protein [Actinoalloteichus hymeniacidonis]|uniref:Purine-cytosine permease-like transporter n=1 Tax=Actinoalloteichus hymeniacidonis TaxID=340345 RepID=A0AAC9HQ76_9PSEU|nr:hypothetical protein [Actinoalloteichus hymeniacidonis]AOS63415.1 purine-cytosine permease-like transporter [Actinoalloteichus hymeniacidonis]MBB5908543.1 hypothetical protein [Actinoalloteichus hymeniacidonis]